MKLFCKLIISLACHILLFFPVAHAKDDDHQSAIKTFKDALIESEYNLTESDTDIGVLATRLFGWEGCGIWGSSKRKAIYSGWQQSWKLMDAVQGKNLDFNDAAALEYLAPPFENEEERAAIRKIFNTVVTIRGGSDFNPLKWWLHVRCDDPLGKCTCVPSTMSAYTSTRDAKSGYARINFCPYYFQQKDLGPILRENANKDLPTEHRANLQKYVNNKGRTWFHELLHIDWASGIDKSYHITDLFAMLTSRNGDVYKLKIYGPQLTKSLAKYKLGAAWWLKRNSDNFSMYAMAKVVQRFTGSYPHLPFAIAIGGVDDDPFVDPDLFSAGDIVIDQQGTATMVSPTDMGECQKPDDDDSPGAASTVVPFNSSAWFLDQSYYPEDYNRQLRGWLAEASPHKNRVRMVVMQTAAGPQWMVFEDTPDDPIKDFCSAKILAKTYAKGDNDDLKFPTELPAFEAHGAKDCVYSGSSDVVGGLTCEGVSNIRCWQDPDWGVMSNCDGGRYMLGIKCDWK